MTRYMALITFTEQGLREVKHTIERAKQFRASVEAAGGKVVSQYWVVGEFDGCVVFEAPNESAAAGLLLSLAHEGNVRTRTLRVFDEQEFNPVLAKS